MPKKRERNKPYSIWRRRLESGRIIYYVRFRKEDGGWGTAHSSGRSTRASAETWARDRTEGARPESAVDRSEVSGGRLVGREEGFRALVERAGEAVWHCDARGRILEANESAAHILGYSDGRELVGIRYLDLFAPEEQRRERAMLGRRRSGLGDRYETTLARKDGGLLRARMAVVSLFERGRFAGYLAMASDLSAERAALMTRLRASERRLTDLVDRFPIAVCAIGRDSTVKYMNSSGDGLFLARDGSQKEGPASLRDCVSPDDRVRYDRVLAAVLGRGESRSLIMDIVTTGTGRSLSLWRFSPIREEDSLLGAYVAIIEIGEGFLAMNRLPGDSFYNSFSLSDRERDIADLLLSDYPYKEIATRLSISLSTARSHVMNVYKKVGIHARDELVLLAKRWQASHSDEGDSSPCT
jgi:PAS domain S-box